LKNELPPHFKRKAMKKLISLALFTVVCIVSQSQAPGGVSSGLNVWLKADAGTSSAINGAFLTSWNDQSGIGNSATQVLTPARPQYATEVMNGNPAVRTTGARYFDVNLNGINDHNFTIFTVTKRQSGSNFQHIIGIQQAGPYVGLGLGYSGSSLLRFFEYGNIVALACVPYAGVNEVPAILSCQFDEAVGKRLWQIRDGIQILRSGNNKTSYPLSGTGKIGRGNDNYGFNGFISEVIVYDRILSDAEKKSVHTYLSVKYGLSVPFADHIYYNDAIYSNDIFGIGKDVVAQGLNQTSSTSASLDDILDISNPSSMDDGDYLICGNNNGATTMSAYAGANCAITKMLPRHWKAKVTGSPGTVTLRFDMTGITGFSGDKLILLMDIDGDGFDDETAITGSYSAPYFTINNVDVPNNAILGIGTGENSWYAVATGNTSDAIWSSTPNGVPQTLTSFCSGSHLFVNSGVTVTNDWATLSCHDFTVNLGGIWNASTGTMNVGGAFSVNGTFNAQSSTLVMNGTDNQQIKGSGITNIYNFTVNNPMGVTIEGSSGGVRARNVIQITNGTLTTNSKLTLISDVSSTGMISALTTGSISGEVIAQRYHNAAAQGWVNISSPVQNKTLQDWNDDLITTGFIGSDFPPPYSFNNIQYYNETQSGGINIGYVGATNINNAIVDGRGYMVFMNGGVMNLDVQGTINSGNQSLPVTYTSTGNASADGWNLIGNPYPCAIDWNSGAWTKTNLSNAVYVWNAAIGQYASFVNGSATHGGSRYIPSSQSFFVRTTGVSPALTLTENCKATVQGTFKYDEEQEAAFTLRIANDYLVDETTLARNSQATLLFEDSYDAFKLRSPLTEVPYISSISEDGADLSINAFSGMNSSTVIPLRVEVGTTGTYTFSHKGLNAFAAGACVTLEDMLTGEIYPLNQFDELTFELEAGNDDLRFQLRVGGTSIANTVSAGCPGMAQGSAEVFIEGEQPVNITWMNNESETILTTIGATGSDVIAGLATGTYFAIIEHNGVCGTTEAEIHISADATVFSNAIVTPVSCPSEADGGVALNLMGGTSPYSVTWSTGHTGTILEGVEDGAYTAFVTDARGCASSVDIHIPVMSQLTSEFETMQESYELMNGSVMIDFYNTSEYAEEFEWSFGDITQNSTDENPSHLFNKKGVYQITLMSKNEDCVAYKTKSIKIVNPQQDAGIGSEMIGTLTDNGVQIMFYFDQPRRLQINAYNVLGQQLIEPINGVYERQTITFSDRRYAANALIEVLDMETGERALLRMGM
jgi:hypothetical protein